METIVIGTVVPPVVTPPAPIEVVGSDSDSKGVISQVK